MASNLLSKLAQFREQEEFIDVRLQVGKDLFPAHRLLLAANSDYFHAMFTNGMKESKQEVIELKDPSISAVALRILLNCIYTGDLFVNKENVYDILAAASHLHITNAIHQCSDFLNVHFVQHSFDLQRYFQLSAIVDRHGLRELKENVQHKMASIYKDICDNEAFLSQINPDQLLKLLSRDDLCAPSETFVFKSVMRWVKYKKEERLPIAAKVIEAVRLGLVDVAVLIEELNTEEIQQVPEVHKILIDASLYFHAPCQMSRFTEKTKPRATGQGLIAIRPKWSQVQYFDVETKLWRPLPSMAVLPGAESCTCTELVGNNLYVAGNDAGGSQVYCYNIDQNLWERLPRPSGSINSLDSLCKMGDFLYAVSADVNSYPQRYSFAKRQWQNIAKINVRVGEEQSLHTFILEHVCYNGAVIYHSNLHAIYGCSYRKEDYRRLGFRSVRRVREFCFDEGRNHWSIKASTGVGGFGSTAFIVNGRLYVAGGRKSLSSSGSPEGDPGDVFVYDGVNDTWSVVEQNHIPPNNLGAVEIEGRVYFIINKFLVGSDIRIPPGEVYPVCLSDWENLGNVSTEAALCYLPLKEGMMD